MRLALLSDVHGNAPALEAVLASIAERQVDETYCLGDLVGYGPFPNEVIARIRADGIPTIMGNYDEAVGFDREDCGCAYRDPEDRRLGQQSFDWTKAHVTADHKAFLRELHPELRFLLEETRVLLVHGSPRKINEYLFEDRPLASVQRIARLADADILVCGHTHRPYVRAVDQVHLVNVGSVGKPKDGDWRACYAVLDVAASTPVQFVRVPYDRAAVVDAILQSDLPDTFARDLVGDDPSVLVDATNPGDHHGTTDHVERGSP